MLLESRWKATFGRIINYKLELVSPRGFTATDKRENTEKERLSNEQYEQTRT